MNIKGLPGTYPYRIPDPGEQFLPGHCTARLLGQYRQQVELLSRQLNNLTVNVNNVTDPVNNDPAAVQG